MNKIKIQTALALFGTLILMSCNKSSNTLKSKLEQMSSLPVHIPYEQMVCMNDSEMIANAHFSKCNYSLIVYVDSSMCSACALKKLYWWNDFLHYETENKVNFFFILETKTKLSELRHSYIQSRLMHEILVDTCGAFRKQNPHIPESQLFHTFLLDERDSVVLVGDPTKNQKIEELLIKTIESPN